MTLPMLQLPLSAALLVFAAAGCVQEDTVRDPAAPLDDDDAVAPGCTCRTVGWEFEVVDPSGSTPRLHVTPGGELQLVYRLNDSRDLRFATRTDGGWNIETVGDGLDEGGYPVSIGTDSAQAPLLGMQDEPARSAAVARRTDGEWLVTTVDAIGNSGWEQDLAVGPDGTEHFMWSRYEAPTTDALGLQYGRREEGGEWSVATVDINGWAAALIVDERGDVHVAYHSFERVSGVLAYAHLPQGGTWRFETVLESRGVGPALVFDADGGLHVLSTGSLNDSGAYPMEYSYRAPNGTWSVTRAADGEGFDPALRLDCHGTIHATWQTGALVREVVYATLRPGGTWSARVLPDTVDGGTAALAVAPDGGVHVAVAAPGLGGLVHGVPVCE
jgi:hypothetical protein